jgi:hypothetical protein
MLIHDEQKLAQRAFTVDQAVMHLSGHSVCELELMRLDGDLTDQELRQIMRCAVELADVEQELRSLSR